jgi:glycosyltransferase 2 family protein
MMRSSLRIGELHTRVTFYDVEPLPPKPPDRPPKPLDRPDRPSNPPEEHSNWTRGALLAGVLLVVIAGLLYYRLRHSPFRWEDFQATFRDVNWGWFALAVALMYFSYTGRALRWRVMLRPLKPNPGFWNIHAATVIGFTAVFLLGRPGELVRPYLIAAKERLSFSSQMAAWLLERIFDLLFVLLIFGYSLTRNPSAEAHLGPSLRWVFQTGGYLVTGIGVICLLVLLAFRNFSGQAQERILSAITFLPDSFRLRVARALQSFSQGMEVTRDTKNLIWLLFYSALEWSVIAASVYCTFQAFPVTRQLVWLDVLVLLGFIAFGSIVQIPGLGGGVQVVSVVVLTEVFGLKLESAAGMALVLWLLSFVAIVPVGLPLALHQGINWRKLRHLKEEVAL